MVQDVEKIITQIRPTLLAANSDVEFLSATALGVVRVNLSGECCSGHLSRLLTILDIEKTVKRLVPGVKVVMEDG